jgi:hypothetical protein
MFKHPTNGKSNSPDGLLRIHQNLKTQRQLTQHVKEILSPQLASHCLHIIHARNKIVLFTDSSAWASKLLYMRQPIMDHLSSQLDKPTKNFTVKVLSNNPTQAYKNRRKPLKPSTKTITNLLQTTDSHPTESLDIALKKLADTL